MDLDKLMNIQFTWDNKVKILQCLSKKTNIRFAIFCAEQVIHLFEIKHLADDRPRKAIETTKLYLEGKATEEECEAAAHAAAHAASYAANAAAAYYAASSAYAAHAAAADAAAYAAYAANAVALHNSDSESIKQEQMDYLRYLIVDCLSEEQKDNWLLVASL